MLLRRQSVDGEEEVQNSYTEAQGMEVATKSQGVRTKQGMNRVPLAQRQAQAKFVALSSSRALAIYANLQPTADRTKHPALRIPKKKAGALVPFASTTEQ